MSIKALSKILYLLTLTSHNDDGILPKYLNLRYFRWHQNFLLAGLGVF